MINMADHRNHVRVAIQTGPDGLTYQTIYALTDDGSQRVFASIRTWDGKLGLASPGPDLVARGWTTDPATGNLELS
jgi:hypothetical protein